RVDGKEAFGMFVNIGAGVTGLLPRSAWRDSTEAANFENKRKGDVIKVRVERIDRDARKLSFGLPGEDGGTENWQEHAKAQASAATSFGSMADLFKGIKGKG